MPGIIAAPSVSMGEMQVHVYWAGNCYKREPSCLYKEASISLLHAGITSHWNQNKDWAFPLSFHSQNPVPLPCLWPEDRWGLLHGFLWGRHILRSQTQMPGNPPSPWAKTGSFHSVGNRHAWITDSSVHLWIQNFKEIQLISRGLNIKKIKTLKFLANWKKSNMFEVEQSILSDLEQYVSFRLQVLENFELIPVAVERNHFKSKCFYEKMLKQNVLMSSELSSGFFYSCWNSQQNWHEFANISLKWSLHWSAKKSFSWKCNPAH